MWGLVLAAAAPHHNLMRHRRFRVDNLSSDIITVAGAEADHALRVLRLHAGDDVVLFDGSGTEAHGRVTTVGDYRFEVQIFRVEKMSASATTLILAVAPPKGSRGDWLVEKCAELGVEQLWLLHTTRTVVEPGAGKLERWRRIASEAAKQSEQPVIMSIEPTRSLTEVLATIDSAQATQVFYGRPGDQTPTLRVQLGELSASGKTPTTVLILVGPEGGFTEQEEQEIERSGAQAMRLSSTILRVETAAIAAAVMVGEWRIAMNK